MLVPAILYKETIEKCSQELFYSDDSFYYHGWIGNDTIKISDNDDNGQLFQYAILDNNCTVVGYFSYRIDWYNSCAYHFGLVSFQKHKPNPVVGFDLKKEIHKIIYDYKIHRIEFRMIKGNPVERHYIKFVVNYGGRCIVLKDSVKDRFGNYHNDLVFEVIDAYKKKNKLLPCPFCGCEVEVRWSDMGDSPGEYPYIECDTCEICMGKYGGTLKELVSMWNHRRNR